MRVYGMVVLAALVACGGCTGTGAEAVGETSSAITVSGYGHYCSITWATGGWAFAWDTNGNDPCTWLLEQSDPGGTIQRAGIFSSSDQNTVITRCTDGHIARWHGNGGNPLAISYNSGVGHPGCIFAVAPRRLPIFDAPFAPSGSISHSTGFDFAMDGELLDVSTFGQSGPTDASIVNYKGDDRPGYIDNHDGHDWLMPKGTPLLSPANGTVVAARYFDTQCTGGDSPSQGEVYLRFEINRTPSTYNERFIVGYFHLDSFPSLVAGQSVSAGDTIGYSGNKGCTSGGIYHLHFAVMRETNVANARTVSFALYPGPGGAANNGHPWTIEPYGFLPPQGVDPWGWRNYPDGALSINLWKTEQAPILDAWGP